MSHFAASYLGLYFLPLSLSWDVRHKWVNSIPEKGHILDNKPFYCMTTISTVLVVTSAEAGFSIIQAFNV